MEPLKLRTMVLRNPGTKVQATITFAIADSDVDYETTFTEHTGRSPATARSSSACCITLGSLGADLLVLLNANDICPTVVHHEFAHIQQWYEKVVYATYEHTPETEEHVAATLGRIGAIVNWWYTATGAADFSYMEDFDLQDLSSKVLVHFEPEDYVDPFGCIPAPLPRQHIGYLPQPQPQRNKEHVESK